MSNLKSEQRETFKTSMPIAAFTTSHARIKLYSAMEESKRKGGRLFYCDTDSVIFDKCNIRSGDCLGDLKDELGMYEYISSFTSIGAKACAYQTKSSIIKPIKNILCELNDGNQECADALLNQLGSNIELAKNLLNEIDDNMKKILLETQRPVLWNSIKDIPDYQKLKTVIQDEDANPDKYKEVIKMKGVASKYLDCRSDILEK